MRNEAEEAMGRFRGEAPRGQKERFFSKERQKAAKSGDLGAWSEQESMDI